MHRLEIIPDCVPGTERNRTIDRFVRARTTDTGEVDSTIEVRVGSVQMCAAAAAGLSSSLVVDVYIGLSS